jgi:hypothetical protein
MRLAHHQPHQRSRLLHVVPDAATFPNWPTAAASAVTTFCSWLGSSAANNDRRSLSLHYSGDQVDPT